MIPTYRWNDGKGKGWNFLTGGFVGSLLVPRKGG